MRRLLVLAAQAGVVQQSDVEALCAGDRHVELTRVSQLQQFAAAARTSSKCPVYLKAAIVELAAIIDQDKDNLCSLDAIGTLRAYYTQYMDNASIKEDHKKQLPEPLKQFVVAYGLRMSNLCKKQMVKALTKGGEAHDLLDEEDDNLLAGLTNNQSPIATVLKAMGGPDEILLPGDLADLVAKNKDNGAQGEKMFIQSKTAPWIHKIQSACANRFKPIYEPLMIPLVRLSNMGFSYKDEPLTCALECPWTAHHVGRWSRIVFLCESLAGLHLVQDTESGELTEGTDQAGRVKIISEEEAIAIEGSASANREDNSATRHLDYKPSELVKLDDLVLDKADSRFKSAVKSFVVGQSEAEKAKKVMISKAMAMIKSQMKKEGIGAVVSSAYRALVSKDTTSTGAAMVKTLDEVMASKQPGGKSTVSGGDAPEEKPTFFSENGPMFRKDGIVDKVKDVLIGLVLLALTLLMYTIIAGATLGALFLIG